MGLKTGIALILIGLCTMASVAFPQEQDEGTVASHTEAPPGAPGPDPVVPPPYTATEPGPYVTND